MLPTRHADPVPCPPRRRRPAVAVTLGIVAALLIGLPAPAEPAQASGPVVADASGPVWRSIGPNAFGAEIAQSPTVPGLGVLVQNDGGILWRTDDAGLSWQRVLPPRGLAAEAFTARVIIDPEAPEHWWLAADLADTAGSGVFETRDGGRSWEHLASFEERLITFSAADAAREALVVATGEGGIGVARTRTTLDGGRTWTDDPTAAPGEDWAGAVAVLGDTLLLARQDGVWRRTGVLAGALSEPERVLDRPLIGSPKMEGDGELVVLSHATAGVFVSRDGGAVWERSADPSEVPIGSVTVASGEVFLDVSAKPRSMLVSDDEGRTFRRVPLPNDEAGMQWVTRWADGSLVVSRWRSGEYRSVDDGASWARVGVPGSSVEALLVQGDRLSAGTMAGVATTSIPVAGSEWGATGSEGMRADRVRALAASGDGSTLWKSVEGDFDRAVIWRSTDGGVSWESVLSRPGSVSQVFVHPADPALVVVASAVGEECWRSISRDGGASWEEEVDGCTEAVVGDPADASRLWFAGAFGVERSEDAGLTAVVVSPTPTSALLLDGNQLVAGGDGVRLGESTAEQAVSVPGGGAVSSIVRAGPRLFAGVGGVRSDGSLGAVLLSEDDGRSWREVAPGMGDAAVLSLVASGDGRWLFAGVEHGGVREVDLAALPPVDSAEGGMGGGSGSVPSLVATGLPAAGLLAAALALMGSGLLVRRVRGGRGEPTPE